MKEELMRFQWILLAVLAFCLGSCKDENNADPTTVPFDPSKPVVISDFTPKEGGAYQKLLIYGENFGTDLSKVNVTIGGKKAIVVSVKSTNIYCFVPSGAFSGEIEVSIGEGDNVVTTTANTNFVYEKKLVTSTLCGYRNDRDDQGWKTGPFEDEFGNKYACGFSDVGFMAFDPRNKDHIYMCYDGHKQIQLIDLKKRWVYDQMDINTIPTGRIRSVCFNKKVQDSETGEIYAEEGDYMFIAIDYDGRGDESPSVYIAKRNDATGVFDNGSDVQLIASYKQCNGATVHPINGELYFNSYEKGQVFRLDLQDYFRAKKKGETWNSLVKTNTAFKQLFTIADPSWEFQIEFHPSGEYAFIIVINNHYIMRSDYDAASKTLITPYTFVGGYKMSGYKDDVGTAARFNNQRQGVFVKNEEYAGRDDEYDFYLADRLNFCIRKITPEGIVSTFAGRGTSTSLADGNKWGTDDGDLREVARFRDVCGILYDDEKEIFYIHDQVGHTIRTISEETEETDTTDEGSDTLEEPEE